MAKTKITLAREVTYGLAAPAPADTPDLATYNRVVVPARVESADPMDSTKTLRQNNQLAVDMPAKGWGDDDVLAALRKAYPECEVDWLVIGEQA
jgi:hypothetical protein